MKRLAPALLVLFVAARCPSVRADPAPQPTQNCHILSPIAEKACYAAQNAAANKAANHASTKQNRKDDLATARASTAPPQDIAIDLLRGGYAEAADKRYRTQLLSSPGHPIVANGQFVYTTPVFDAADRRTALYLQLFRIVGKANTPPSARKMLLAQAKAQAKLVQLENARASGQPVPAHHASPGTAATAAATAAAGNSSSHLVMQTGSIDWNQLIPPPSTGSGTFAVQSVDGVAMMTAVSPNAPIGTTFNAAEIDFNDKGQCANAVPGASESHSAQDRDAILRCFAHAVHNLRVQEAQDAITEYQKWQHDPYGFTPPSGFTYAAPARPVTDGHGHSLSVAGLYSGEPAEAPDVRMFGKADAVNAFLGGDAGRTSGNDMLAKLATSNETDMPLLRAAMGDPPTPDVAKTLADLDPSSALWKKIESAIGTAPADDTGTAIAGGVAGAGIMSSETAYDAVLPYASKAKFIGDKLVPGVTADEADLGPPGLVAAFVTTMIEAGVDEGIKVFGNKDLPGDLAGELAAAKAAPDPSIAELAGSQSGRTELFTVFVGGTQHLQW